MAAIEIPGPVAHARDVIAQQAEQANAQFEKLKTEFVMNSPDCKTIRITWAGLAGSATSVGSSRKCGWLSASLRQRPA